MPKTFPLSKPISVIQENVPVEVKEITLREPTAEEMFDFEHPFRFLKDKEGREETVINGAALRKWIGRLSGVPEAIGAMAARDVQQLAGWIADELAPAKN